MRHTGKLIAAAFVLLVCAVGARALGVVDFVEGQMIPTTLKNNYIFSGGPIYEFDAKTVSFTVSENESGYLINSSGGAITVTLPTPSTMPTGKCWNMILTTAGNAATLNAGTYSVNGAVTDASMDAAGDSLVVCNNGAGYQYLSRYIH